MFYTKTLSFIEFIQGTPLEVDVLHKFKFIKDLLNDDWKIILDGLKNEEGFSSDYHDVAKYLENPEFCKRGHEALEVILTERPEITVDKLKAMVCEKKRQDFINYLDSLTSTKKIEDLQEKEKEKLKYHLGNKSPLLKCDTECIMIHLEIDGYKIEKIKNINKSTIQDRQLVDLIQQRSPTLKLKTIFQILKDHEINRTALRLCEVAIRVIQPQ